MLCGECLLDNCVQNSCIGFIMALQQLQEQASLEKGASFAKSSKGNPKTVVSVLHRH